MDNAGNLTYLTPSDIYFSNPPPLSPSLIKGGGIYCVREASPLFDSPYSIYSFKGEGEDFIKRGLTPLLNSQLGYMEKKEFYFRLIRYSFSQPRAASAASSLFCSRFP